MTTIVFSANVEDKKLNEAEEVLAGNGITLTDAFNQMVNFIIVEKRMPHFDCFIPNDETLQAIYEAEEGNLVTIGSVADLLSELNEDD